MNLLRQLELVESLFEEREPQVRAFVPEEGRFKRLREEARWLLAQYPDPQARPALFGMLVGVKDVFHVSGLLTQAGCHLPPVALQGEEASCITRLKEAGALILGKTVTTEFAYFAPGPSTNPHNPLHTPGGSSSGSAAAVGAGMGDLAIGTQTIGSTIRPAAFCGVVGFKPSFDRIRRDGLIPLSISLDHVGIFAPSLTLARLAAGCMIQDWQIGIIPFKRPVLGIPAGPYLEKPSGEALARYNDCCQRLTESGFEVRQIEVFQDYERIRARHLLILTADAARFHAAWFEEFPDLYSPTMVKLIQQGREISDEELAFAIQERVQYRSELSSLMDEQGIDLWISPPAPGPAPRGLDNTGDPIMNLPWSHSGLPAINIPAGKFANGLPAGLQVSGRWYGDELLLVWAEELEYAIRFRQFQERGIWIENLEK